VFKLYSFKSKMVIPFIIGKNSSGENQCIDLAETPLLMMSYNEEVELLRFFQQLFHVNYLFGYKNYLISNSRRIEHWQIETDDYHLFIRDEPELSNIITRFQMLKLINDEISRRKQIMKTKKIKDFKRYHSLNTWNEHKLSYQFFLLDDVWDIVIAKPKSLSLSLIRILLEGSTVGIHTIFASGISYRNLLQQLVTIQPKITKELQKKFGIPEPKQIGVLGHELILNTDGLVFYKMPGSLEMQRLYSL
jgi:hypothetical protein